MLLVLNDLNVRFKFRFCLKICLQQTLIRSKHSNFIQADNLNHGVEFSPSLWCFSERAYFYSHHLFSGKCEPLPLHRSPTVHKHINTAWARNAALLIDRNPKFLQWKCLCSPSAATQWVRLSGVSWRHCKRRPSLIPHIAQQRRWPWQQAIKNALQARIYVQSPWYTKWLSCMWQNMFQWKLLT